MPPLKNPKEEIVAQHLAKGSTQVEAYVAAGFEGNDSHANRYVVGNGRIEERVKELLGSAAERVGIDIDWWLNECINLHSTCKGQEKPDSIGSNGALEKIARYLGAYKKDNEQGKGMTQDEWVKHILKDRKDD